MTDEVDVLKKAITEHDKALRLKNINVELYSHLTGSIYWLLKYSEKYNIPLPKKDELIRMMDKSEFLIDEMKGIASQPTVMADQPTGNTKNTSTDEGTEL